MDLDHGNGRNKYSRTDIKETPGIGSNKQSGKNQELVRNQSRNNRHWIVGNGTNKHSTRHLELDDEAGSSEHSSEVSGSFKHLKYLELDVETGSSNQSDTYSEVINGVAGIESNHVEINPEVIKVWGNNHNFVVPSDSSRQSEVIQEEKDRIKGDILISAEKQSSTSYSSSSSSSGSSTDDQFQVDIKLSKTRLGPKPEEDTIQSLQDKHHVSGISSYQLEECQNGVASLTLTSQVSSVTHETTLIQSPPVQLMDRLGEFDSYKIPSAVFARSKSTTPVDWSLPSNESLFSIQLGNYSFSRDHIVSSKSGELFKSGEFVELSPFPVVPVGDTDKKGVESDKSEATSVSDDAVKDKTGPSVEESIMKKPTRPIVSWNSATIAHHSIDSVANVHSIAFPVRNKKKQKMCAWPSCYCSNCWLAVCYSWKCTFLSDGKSVSSKEKAQQQQQKEHPMASSVSSKSARCNCCSCFSSRRWHWCCCCNCCRRNCCSRTL